MNHLEMAVHLFNTSATHVRHKMTAELAHLPNSVNWSLTLRRDGVLLPLSSGQLFKDTGREALRLTAYLQVVRSAVTDALNLPHGGLLPNPSTGPQKRPVRRSWEFDSCRVGQRYGTIEWWGFRSSGKVSVPERLRDRLRTLVGRNAEEAICALGLAIENREV